MDNCAHNQLHLQWQMPPFLGDLLRTVLVIRTRISIRNSWKTKLARCLRLLALTGLDAIAGCNFLA